MNDSAENFLAAHEDPRPPSIYRDGDVVAGWRITAFLGRGGNGEVYRVEHETDAPAISSPAAIKVLHKDANNARARFLRETELLAKIGNPSFPRFIEKGEVEGRPYFVTELLEPRNLPEEDSEVADFMLKLCDGVAVLHRMGYVHRDIKPGNILWRGASPVLIDLGLVKDVARNFEAEGTSISLIDGHVAGVGTLGYAAPEQLTGDAISPSADIHALGVLANTCFKGHPPAYWGRIIDHATGSLPARRYPDVATFARAIRRRHWRRNFATIGILLLAMFCIAVAWMAGRAVFKTPESRIDTHAEDKAYLREKRYFERIAAAERKERELRRQEARQSSSRSEVAFDPSAPGPYEMFIRTNLVARALLQEQKRISREAEHISDMMKHQASITNIDEWAAHGTNILHEMTNLYPRIERTSTNNVFR